MRMSHLLLGVVLGVMLGSSDLLPSFVAHAQTTNECETSPSLTCNVPSPEGSLVEVEEISNGGRHYRFLTWEYAIEACIEYGDDLQHAGWTIERLSTPGGIFSGTCSVIATDNGPGGRAGRYLRLDVAGPTGTPTIDGCIWPTRPTEPPFDVCNL